MCSLNRRLCLGPVPESVIDNKHLFKQKFYWIFDKRMFCICKKKKKKLKSCMTHVPALVKIMTKNKYHFSVIAFLPKGSQWWK